MDKECVYIADSGNHRIQVFLRKSVGCFVPSKIFGFKGTGDDQLLSPCGLTVDSENLFVADSGNSRIQVFKKSDGSRVRSFGESELQSPVDVAIGGPYVYVSDSSKHCLYVFDKADGGFIRTVGSRGSADGQCREPGCLLVHGSDVYVSERGNKRVQ